MICKYFFVLLHRIIKESVELVVRGDAYNWTIRNTKNENQTQIPLLLVTGNGMNADKNSVRTWIENK